MRVPLRWIKEYVDIAMSPEDLAHMLTMAGLEVEAIEYIGKDWGAKLIAAQIVQLEKVAGSDHLSYTKIDTGSQILSVICGAPNIQQGDKVPLALPGAQLGDFTISETQKMGYLSQGMLCSLRELGLGSDHSGIYILDPETPLGTPLVELLGEVVLEFAIKAHRGDLSSIIGIAREIAALTGQSLRMPQLVSSENGVGEEKPVKVTVEDPDLCPRYRTQVISNVKIGPSPSWMGQRLLAAGMRPINNIVDITNYVMLEFGQPLHGFDYDRVPEHHIIVRRAQEDETMTTLDNVKRKLTPEMLLIADPQGPTAIAGVMGGAASEVSAATTTILLEAANFLGSNIRRTSTALGLRTDASSRFEKGLDPELVTLGANRAAQLMAELAGGTVHPTIVDCYPKPIQPRTLLFSLAEIEWLTSMKVTADEAMNALRALYFGVVPNGEQMLVTVPTYRTDIQEGADLVEEVIRLIGYDKIPSTIPTGPLPEPATEDWFAREQEIRTLLIGAGLNEIVTYTLTSRARMLNLLAHADANSVSSLYGEYNGRAKAGPCMAINDSPTRNDDAFDPQSFPAVTLANSLSSDLEVLRLTLMSNMLETLQENSKRNKAGLRFFEIGRRYLPSALAPKGGTRFSASVVPTCAAVGKEASAGQELPDERRTIALALSGPAETSWIPELARPADFYDLKGILETLLAGLTIKNYRFVPAEHPIFHPGRCARLELFSHTDAGEERGQSIGILGEVHPLVQQRYDLPHRAYLCELDLALLYEQVPTKLSYQPISRHQELTRDLALVVDQQIPAQAVQSAIFHNGGELLRSVTLFDVYTGEPIPAGKKNLTYALVYQAQNRTLTDA